MSNITEDVQEGIKYINSIAKESAKMMGNLNCLMQEQRDQVVEMKETVIEIKDLVKENMESKEEVLVSLKKDIRKDVKSFYTKVLTISIPMATILALAVTFI